MDGGTAPKAARRNKRPKKAKRSAVIGLRDVSGELRTAIERFCEANGDLSLSDGGRQLIEIGLQTHTAKAPSLTAMVGDIQQRLAALLQDGQELGDRLPGSVSAAVLANLPTPTPVNVNYNKTMLITLLECVMLLRLMAQPQKDMLQKAQKNTMETYETLRKEGTI